MGPEPEPDVGGQSAIKRWRRVITRFERTIIFVLVALLMVVVTISTFELGWLLLQDLRSWERVALDVEEMLELFGFFLLVLIGLELITTLKVYMGEGVVHGEVVLEVALIAIAQKIIIMDTSRAGGTTIFGLAALILALASAFWLLRSAARRRRRRDQPPRSST